MAATKKLSSSTSSVGSVSEERFEDAASELDTLEEADAIRKAPAVPAVVNNNDSNIKKSTLKHNNDDSEGGPLDRYLLRLRRDFPEAAGSTTTAGDRRHKRSLSADFGALPLLGRRGADFAAAAEAEEEEGNAAEHHLPSLEAFLARLSHLDLPPVDCGSLAASLDLLDNDDVLPSTPLTAEEQLRFAAAGEELLTASGGVVPINHLGNMAMQEPPSNAAAEDWGYDIRGMMHNAAEQAEEFAISIWHKFQSWKVIHFTNLPQWLQDNDFLHFGHRPPLPTSECFKSIIRIHTETGNIWTHLLGVVAFVGLAAFFLSRPSAEIQFQEKLVFACFFMGAIVCMGLSFTYHTLCCHENKEVGRLFAKFDYCGISFLTVGSFVPWLYYSFYCEWKPQVIYLSIVIILGIGAVVVSTFDFFAGPKFRPLRAGVFIFFGLSGIAPATHFGIANGWEKSIDQAALGWLVLMGLLYIVGALLYAMRIPERFFPGKLDIWFHSHQIFHCFVIAGAFVHYHGVTIMAIHRLQKGDCPIKELDSVCLVENVSF